MFEGWPGGVPTKPIEFDTKPQPLFAATAAVTAPETCEARITVRGLGKERVTVTVGNRTLRMPAGASDPYTFPFPFFFRKGENRIAFAGLQAAASSFPAGASYRNSRGGEVSHGLDAPDGSDAP